MMILRRWMLREALERKVHEKVKKNIFRSAQHEYYGKCKNKIFSKAMT
jgi:hypothetical protein